MAAPATPKGTCTRGRRRRRATLAAAPALVRAAPALAAVLLAAPCVGLVQNHALAASRPARARPTRPCVKATATRLPSLASNVLKLKEEVLNPKPDANGWCLGRESVEQALEEMRNGRPVVVTDDGDRENEGDLIFAAETVSQQTMAFVVRHTSGVICTAMYGEDLDRLKLGPMVSKNEDPKGTAFAVTVDLKDGVTTGISAGDRARTIRALADPSSKPGHFCRPGHIFPLRARPGGVLERGGHTEAAVDMARLAGLHPAGGLCEIVRDSDGEMSRWDDLEVFAREHDLAFTTIQDLKTYREQVLGEAVEEHVLNEAHDAVQERRVDLGKATRMPTSAGLFDAVCATDRETGLEHIAMLKGYTTDAYSYLQRADAAMPVDGDSGAAAEAPLVRLHSECATGDIFGSRRCDCGEQLKAGLEAIQAAEAGVLIYLRGHEGRGIGLGAKLEAYTLQDEGRDTIEANEDLGHPVDARDYEAGAAILRDLGVSRVRLLTNNPAKCEALEELGIKVVERIPVVTEPNEENYKYLLTKQKRMGHLLGLTP